MITKIELITEYKCEFGEETIFTIIKKGNELIAGTYCNAGLAEHYNFDYDDNFSLDENINDFIDLINESEMRLI